MPSGVHAFTDNTSLAFIAAVIRLYHGLQTRSSNYRPLEWANPSPENIPSCDNRARVRPTFPDWSAALIIELLRAGKPVRFRARGGSMWPAIPGGSLVEVTPGAPRAAGEFVAFERAGRVVIHRVLQIMAAGIVAQGDALQQTDGVIAHERVLGTARVIERRGLRWRVPSVRELRVMLHSAWLWITG